MFELANQLSSEQSKVSQSAVPALLNQSAPANNQGVVNLSNGVVYDVFAIPTSLTWTVSSAAGSGAIATTVYGFNNNVLNAAVGNNGSGGGSITNSYGDGFSGKVYENYARSANGGRGLKIEGMTITSTIASTNTQTSTPFSTMNLNIISANGQGSVIPLPINLQEAVRNTQFLSGVLTVKKGFYLNALTQLQLTMPVDTTLVFTVFTDASGFKG